MTRWIVVSDTHLPRKGRELPRELLEALECTDAIVHLGDFTAVEVAAQLEGFGPMHAVHGNNDAVEIFARFPAELRMTVHGHRVAMIHGHRGGRTAEVAAASIRDADVVLFGHSHKPNIVMRDSTLFFNPGSPIDRRWYPHRAFGIIDFTDNVVARHVFLP